MATRQPVPSVGKLEDVARLSARVVRILGLNPGPFSLQGTNTYLIGSGRSRLLVDAGEGASDYVPLLLRCMQDHGADRISDVLITHYHRDHTQGLKDLRAQFGSTLRAWKMMPNYKGDHGPSFDLAAAGVRELKDGQELSTEDGDTTLRVLATPGHTPDHCCFVLKEESSLFSGDCVLGGSSAVFEDLHSYMRSLHLLLATLPKGESAPAPEALWGDSAPTCADGSSGLARRIYPGHGPLITDGHEAVRQYIQHRTARERQVVTTLQRITGSPILRYTGLSPFGIVRVIYPQLNWTLRMAAAWNVEKHLDKLEADGVARSRNWSWIPLPLMGMRLDRLFLRRWYLR